MALFGLVFLRWCCICQSVHFRSNYVLIVYVLAQLVLTY